MSAMATLPHASPSLLLRQTLDGVVCAVDDSPGSAAAARTAITLATCAPSLRFVSVTDPVDPDARLVTTLGERRARHALDQGRAQAAAAGIDAGAELVHDRDVAAALTARAGARNLLVAGTHGNSRAAGALTGSVATALAHRAGGPLLIARGPGKPPGASPRILVAVDDTDAAFRVAELAGAIAGACGGYVHLVHVQGPQYGAATRRRLAELALDLIELTGAEPIVDVARGVHVANRIVEFAERGGASLVVVGRRGRPSGRGIGSVSERVVHTAPCSVLVAPASPPL